MKPFFRSFATPCGRIGIGGYWWRQCLLLTPFVILIAARHRTATSDLIRLLLERGADVHHRNKAGQDALTPLGDWAKRTIDWLPEPKPEVRELLLQHGAKP